MSHCIDTSVLKTFLKDVVQKGQQPQAPNASPSSGDSGRPGWPLKPCEASTGTVESGFITFWCSSCSGSLGFTVWGESGDHTVISLHFLKYTFQVYCLLGCWYATLYLWTCHDWVSLATPPPSLSPEYRALAGLLPIHCWPCGFNPDTLSVPICVLFWLPI